MVLPLIRGRSRFQFLIKVGGLLSAEERTELQWISLAVLLMAALEVVGIASITPFIAVVADPTLIQKNSVLAFLYRHFGFADSGHFIVFVGVLALIVLLLSNSFSALTNWLLLNFTHQRMHSVAFRLLRTYLSQPYSFFLERNNVELQKNILGEVGRVVGSVLVPLVFLIARSMAALVVIALLFSLDPLLATILFLLLGGAYTAIFWKLRLWLARIGKASVERAGERYQSAAEALQAIKDVKFLGAEAEFSSRYEAASSYTAKYEAIGQAIAALPRYALETVAFGGGIVIVIYFLLSGKDVQHALPLIMLYAFAGYRLLPAVQNIYASATQIRFNLFALDAIWLDAQLPNDSSVFKAGQVEPIEITKEVCLKGISYKYAGREEGALNDVSLSLPARTTVGIVGGSGAGKTTLADILLGLLTPTSGQIVTDGNPITKENVARWRAGLGYVPQTIYLADNTIAANIAFGIAESTIDMQMVEQAARHANLHDFIINELPGGYLTRVGDRGVRLSGGQRQRVAIARALYRQPEFLILDEATSALDGVTEDVVMEAINGFAHRKTLLIIAHRLTTLKKCDEIFMLTSGRMVARGTYEELLRSSMEFRAMAKLVEDGDAAHRGPMPTIAVGGP